jgi:hypothetical protein
MDLKKPVEKAVMYIWQISTNMNVRTLLLWLIAAAFCVETSLAGTNNWNIEYTAVSGYFLQDLNSTNAANFDYVSPKREAKTC